MLLNVNPGLSERLLSGLIAGLPFLEFFELLEPVLLGVGRARGLI